MGLLRTISGRVRSFQAIRSAVIHHGKRVAQKLHDRFDRRLPEHLKIDFWLLMQAIFELLKQSCDTLIGAEHHLVGERGNDKTKQNKRDEDFDTLGSTMLGFRTTFTGIYNPANVEEFGFPTVLGRTAFDRLRQGEYLVETLGQPDVQLPEPKFTDGIDLQKEVAKVRTVVEALRVSNAEAEAELKQAQTAKVDKDRAQGDWDLLFPWSARILTGFFIWAGEPELARFITPSSRRPGRTRAVAQQERRAVSEGNLSPGHEVPGDEVPGDEVPGDEVPGDEVPGDEVPGDEVVGDEVPEDDSPGDTAPEDITPAPDDATG